jgi:hypothetical protein
MEILIPAERIQERVRTLAQQIAADYRDRPVTIVGVLTGALVFLADLIRHLDLSLRVGRNRPVVYHPSVEITHYGRVSTRQHIGYASSQMAVGFVRYLRKSGCPGWGLLAYKLVVSLDAPAQLLVKGVQYLWRRARGQRDKADKSLLAFRGFWHFLTRGLVAFWRA